MQPIRRRQLIDATIASIEANGFSETTVSRISARAGVSTGVVHHYFGNKSDLLEATLRDLANTLRREVVERLHAARDSRERVLAIIDGNLAPSLFHRAGVTAWLAFWGEAPNNPRFARIQNIIIRRLRGNLVQALRPIVAPARLAHVADGIGTLLDGLWLRAALTGGGVTHAEATALAHDYLDMCLALDGEAQRRDTKITGRESV
jgi:transcriptional repressor BetI